MTAQVGDIIRHQWYEHDIASRWESEVLSIDEEDNSLEVSVTSIHGQSHPESWNLAHTNSALNQGEYIKKDPSGNIRASFNENK